MTERSKKSAHKITKTGKKCKRRRANSKNSTSISSPEKHSTSSTVNSDVKAPTMVQNKGQDSRLSVDSVATYSSPDSAAAYDSTTDTSLQLTSSVESDRYASSTCIDIRRPNAPRHPEDGKESNINADTMRWNSLCDDPTEETKRLEIYKANRRQRYYELAKTRSVDSRYYAKDDNTGE